MEIVDDQAVTPAQRYLDAGSAAQRVGNLPLAAERYVAAIRYDPECVGALANLSIVLFEQGNYMAAVACARRAIASSPPSPFLLANLGTILFRMEHYDAAVQVMERAIELDPNQPGCWHSLALARSVREPERANEHFGRGLMLAPDDHMAQKHLALLELSLGRWRDGFTRLDRAMSEEREGRIWFTGIPEWRGQDLEGKTILVHYEQGFGDTIQFCRFVRRLGAASGARTILSVSTPLVRLLAASNVADEVVDFGDPAPQADYHATVMSILRYLDVEEAILEPQEAYLVALSFGPRIKRGPDTLLTVGVCWAGSPGYATDRLRSMPFDNFLSIADIPGVQLYSLQKGDRAEDVAKFGGSALIPDLSAMVGDFADLAHVIDQLDLVVSVDTSVLHLAGGLRKKALGLLPYNRCWRWGRGSETTPFYPSVRLITQESPGDWVGVMIRVRQMIAKMLEVPEGINLP